MHSAMPTLVSREPRRSHHSDLLGSDSGATGSTLHRPQAEQAVDGIDLLAPERLRDRGRTRHRLRKRKTTARGTTQKLNWGVGGNLLLNQSRAEPCTNPFGSTVPKRNARSCC